MCHHPKVADTDESWREHVQQESAKELIDGQGHEALFVLVRRVTPAERDRAVGKRDESMV